MCRPRRRRQRTEVAATAAEPSASIETCAPPPVISPTTAARSAPCVDGDLRAEGAGPVKRRLGDVDGHHAGAEGHSDENRRKPDSATAMHGQPVAGPHSAVRGHRTERGGEPAAQAGRGHEVHR